MVTTMSITNYNIKYDVLNVLKSVLPSNKNLFPLHEPKFIGNENEINLKTKNPEFIEWKWVPPEDLPNIIVDFKKKMYLDLLKNIKRFID